MISSIFTAIFIPIVPKIKKGKRTKKVGITGKYGVRYGSSLRKVIRKIEVSQFQFPTRLAISYYIPVIFYCCTMRHAPLRTSSCAVLPLGDENRTVLKRSLFRVKTPATFLHVLCSIILCNVILDPFGSLLYISPRTVAAVPETVGAR